MKALTQLNNVERARLLFELFPREIPAFLQFQKAITDNLVRDPDQLKEKWTNEFFQLDFWMQQVSEIQRKLDRYTHQLAKRSTLFADQLFDGYLAMYSAHCLHQYITHQKPDDPRFIGAVEILFK